MPRPSRSLVLAWLGLAGLSGVAAAIALAAGQGLARPVAGVAIMAVALLKARIILSRYLGLDRAPGWLSGGMWGIGAWALVILALYML